jgi:hypothetical protein
MPTRIRRGKVELGEAAVLKARSIEERKGGRHTHEIHPDLLSLSNWFLLMNPFLLLSSLLRFEGGQLEPLQMLTPPPSR